MKENGERQGNFPREIRRKIAVPVWEGLLRKFNLEFSPESKQNLLEANELLKTNSIVFFINHKSFMEDAQLSVSMVFSFLTNAKRIIGPAAVGHYDPSRDWKNAFLLRALRPLGIEILPIARPEILDKLDATTYSDEQKQLMKDNLLKATKDVVRQPGALYGIAPEGTSKIGGGALSLARNGIGFLESYDTEEILRYLPVAIELEKFSDQPKIQVGKPYSLEELDLGELPDDPKKRAKFLTTIHMLVLAGMLPPEMRGVYRELLDIE